MRSLQILKTGVLILVVVGLAMGGLALAQTDDGGTGGPGVPPAAYERILDLLAPLVDDGTLTDAQAAAVAERLAGRGFGDADPLAARLARIAEHLEAAVAAGGLSEEEAAEKLAEAQERLTATRLRRLEAKEAHERRLAAVIDALGVTTDELRSAAADGQSLADLAAGNDVPTDALVDALVAPLAERLDAAVAEGDVSEEDAAARLAEAEERMAERIDEPIADRRLTDRRPKDRRLTDRRLTDERPTDERPTDERPTDERPTDERPTDEP